jgi:hypothetical protein
MRGHVSTRFSGGHVTNSVQTAYNRHFKRVPGQPRVVGGLPLFHVARGGAVQEQLRIVAQLQKLMLDFRERSAAKVDA